MIALLEAELLGVIGPLALGEISLGVQVPLGVISLGDGIPPVERLGDGSPPVDRLGDTIGSLSR